MAMDVGTDFPKWNARLSCWGFLARGSIVMGWMFGFVGVGAIVTGLFFPPSTQGYFRQKLAAVR